MQTSYFSIAIMGLSVLVFIISCVLLFSGRESDEVFAAKVRATEDFNKKIDEEYEREYEIKLAPLKAIYDEQRQYEFEKWNEDHKFDLSLYKDALTKEKNAFDRLCEDAGIPERYRNEESLTGLCSFLKSRPEATLDEAFSYLERKPENSSERSWHSTTTDVQSAGLGPEFDAIFDNPFFRDPEGFIAKAGYTESSDLSDELAAKIINKTAKMMNKIAAAESTSVERHTTTAKTTTRTTTSASNVTFIDPRKPRN